LGKCWADAPCGQKYDKIGNVNGDHERYMCEEIEEKLAHEEYPTFMLSMEKLRKGID
jgi:hypothetical protein